MDKTKLKWIGVGVLLLALGFGVGKFSNPAKVITKVETKEVIKYVQVKQTDKNIVLTTKKTIQKDGTVVIESKKEDKSIINTNTNSTSSKEFKSSTITIRDIGLNIGALAIKDLNHLSNKTEYGFTIKKRIFSSVTLNGLITTDKKIGLGLGWDF